MNAFDLLESIGNARDVYIAAAMEEAPHKRRISGRRLVMVALAAALALLMVGCAVAYVLSLQELKIAEEPGIRNFDTSGQWAGPTEVTEAVISVRGYPGSANQLATREWYEFVKTYDPEGKLISEEQPEEVSDSHYYAYGCYTKEMAEKVDEIAEKYHLKLLSPETTVQRWQTEAFWEALGIDGICHGEKTAKPVSGAGYFYPEGNFKYEFDLFLPVGEEVSPMISAYMLYTRKDYFDPDYQSIDQQQFTEWTYVTADGSEVLIAMTGWGGYLFGETEDAYITVSLQMAGCFRLRDTEDWNRKCMEQAAEAIDFSLAPNLPDMTALEESFAQADAAYEAERAAAAQKNRQTHTTYASAIQKYLDGTVEWPYNREFYTLVDVTGDGEPELLLARDERHFNDILTIRDGTVVSIDYWKNLDLCKDNVILQTSYFPLDVVSDDYDNPRYYSFSRIQESEDGKWVRVPFVSINCDTATHEWTMTNEETGVQTSIAKEEIADFLSQYPKLEIEMKPISEFPME